jgi:hypothetical protein
LYDDAVEAGCRVGSKKGLLFLKKKKQKDFWSCGRRQRWRQNRSVYGGPQRWPCWFQRRRPSLAEVFCFFFSKKKRLLSVISAPAV